jgi:myo-inositol-1-phosphate synthase
MKDASARRSASGDKLGILIPGLGSVTTTLLAGVFAARKGLARPVGSLTQLGRMPGPSAAGRRAPFIKDALGLAPLESLVFGAWDILPDAADAAAEKGGVLRPEHLEAVRDDLAAVVPMPAVFDRRYVRNLQPVRIKTGRTKMDLAEQVKEDISAFRTRRRLRRLVMCWAGSTEVHRAPGRVHASLKAFEAGLKRNDPGISPSQIYAYAALDLGIPHINGSPHLTTDCPALAELAESRGAPVCGKDFKTGQTLLKTALAPALRDRMLGVSGWFSMNILGNRDGEVLRDEGSLRSKAKSKLAVLGSILDSSAAPELYGGMAHQVKIHYYPPRGDDKESWDAVDLFGWMGYPMQIKIDMLLKDSILAAPVMLDLILFADLARRSGRRGIQDWLSFYFKSPQTPAGSRPVHDLFAQKRLLDAALADLFRSSPSSLRKRS